MGEQEEDCRLYLCRRHTAMARAQALGGLGNWGCIVRVWGPNQGLFIENLRQEPSDSPVPWCAHSGNCYSSTIAEAKSTPCSVTVTGRPGLRANLGTNEAGFAGSLPGGNN